MFKWIHKQVCLFWLRDFLKSDVGRGIVASGRVTGEIPEFIQDKQIADFLYTSFLKEKELSHD
jgi:hypothetical protein